MPRLRPTPLATLTALTALGAACLLAVLAAPAARQNAASAEPVAAAAGPRLGAALCVPVPQCTATQVAPAAPVATSGSALPVGNIAATGGTWKQIWAQDFTTTQAEGRFPGAYTDLTAYPSPWQDTSRRGVYDPGIISFHDGLMDIHLHSVGGTPHVAAPVPLVGGRWNSLTSGRYTIRFKADRLSGYKTAWLLWPDSNDWAEGEIDFPEGALDGTIEAYNHCPGRPAVNCFAQGTTATYAQWHTATVEWIAGKRVSFYLDGRLIGQDTTAAHIPRTAMHWVIQTETSLDRAPAASTDGHVLIDWAAIYSWQS